VFLVPPLSGMVCDHVLLCCLLAIELPEFIFIKEPFFFGN